MAQPLFVEPTTGRTYPPASSPYEGVEWAWNASNFWVCMQLPEPHSDVRVPPGAVSWAFGIPGAWEALFASDSAAAVPARCWGRRAMRGRRLA